MGDRFDTFSPPPESGETASATEIPDDGELSPGEAAALLAETTHRAEEEFALQRPLLTFSAAVTVLVAYGAVWLSVRNQHPYTGPTGTALAVLYGVLAAWVVLNFVVVGRAISGRSSRQRRLQGIVFATIWICVYVFQGALWHVSHSHAIAYGVYPAVAPLIVVGAAAAGWEASRDRLAPAGAAAIAVALGAFAAFAGPAGVWGVIAVTLSTLLLITAGVQLLYRRRT